MKPKQMAWIAPKRALADYIVDAFTDQEIRNSFHISQKADIRKRLEGKNKADLVSYLTKSKKGRDILKQVEEVYKLDAPPTFYLAHLHQKPDYQTLVKSTRALAKRGREGGLHFKEEAVVRVVYCSGPAQRMSYYPEAVEVPLFYEERIEYTESNPQAKDFGEPKHIHSLEKAFIWLVDGHAHAVICCHGFEPVRPILGLARKYLGFDWVLPNLTSEMMYQITYQSKPRSATFSSLPGASNRTGRQDALMAVKTVTLSDPELKDREIYRQMSHDDDRLQTAGFYSDHPRFSFGGLGVARRYARIWTPAHTSNRNYIALAVDLIERTEHELRHAYQADLAGFVNFYQDYAVSVEKHRLYGAERDCFNDLVRCILEAQKNDGELSIGYGLVQNLLKYQKRLRLVSGAAMDCPNCGYDTLLVCPTCHQPLVAAWKGDHAILLCPKRTCGIVREDGDEITCQCGAPLQYVSLENHVDLYPKLELLEAIWQFIGKMQDVSWQGLFAISGLALRLIPQRSAVQDETISLDQLKAWRQIAHFGAAYAIDGKRDKFLRILKQAREKCLDTGYHPRKEDCELCLHTKMTRKHLQAGAICLPRIFGLPIEKEGDLDGMHNGYEHADVKYRDMFVGTGEEARLGIHLKSRTNHARRPLGHGVESIRGLYTQLVHSAYESTTGKVDFNVLGVSVPNVLSEEVRTSLRRTANLWGFPLLILEEDDWIRIVDEADRKLSFSTRPLPAPKVS